MCFDQPFSEWACTWATVLTYCGHCSKGSSEVEEPVPSESKAGTVKSYPTPRACPPLPRPGHCGSWSLEKLNLRDSVTAEVGTPFEKQGLSYNLNIKIQTPLSLSTRREDRALH